MQHFALAVFCLFSVSVSGLKIARLPSLDKWSRMASLATDTSSCTGNAGTILLSNKACRSTIGPFDIIAEECEGDISQMNFDNIVPTNKDVIRLMDVGSGWGNGAHPTTKLCLKFILQTVKKGDKVLDYGTGSGILSIAAAKLGADHCVAVDIDEDTLIAAEINGRINGVSGVLDVVHTRCVYVGEERFPISDVTVANILPVCSSELAHAFQPTVILISSVAYDLVLSFFYIANDDYCY